MRIWAPIKTVNYHAFAMAVKKISFPPEALQKDYLPQHKNLHFKYTTKCEKIKIYIIYKKTNFCFF